ncbi:MAG: hypothetical protein GX836_08455 [Spirochaetales bacterium]|nr:hypothetical protein [Spirochaetales bacterium]
MTAKQYLSQAYQCDQRISSKLQQIDVLRSLSDKVTSRMRGNVVSYTRNVTTLEDTIIRLMEAEKELNQQIDTLVDLKRDIMENLNRLGNFDYQIVLEKRYLCFLSWQEIATDLQFGLRWVHVLHNKALQALDEVLNQQKEAS